MLLITIIGFVSCRKENYVMPVVILKRVNEPTDSRVYGQIQYSKSCENGQSPGKKGCAAHFISSEFYEELRIKCLPYYHLTTPVFALSKAG